MKRFVFSLLALAPLLPGSSQLTTAQDRALYCNSVQDRDGFIRYPFGTIGVWSTEMGEIGSVMTRTPRIYPCLDSVVARPLSNQWRFVEEDWRSSISGDPSMMVVDYNPRKPCGASRIAMTVTPHVSVFRVTFPHGAGKRFLVLDFGKPKVDPWAKLNAWKERTLRRVDRRTIEATVNEPGKNGAFYRITFSAPFAGSGTIVDTSGTVEDGATVVKGPEVAMFVRFEAETVTVAVAESFTSMKRAKEFLAAEFTGFNAARRACLEAWNRVLSRVDMEGSETARRMAYTALYTICANVIDASDGSCYLPFYPRPRALSSSDYWQFIGGFHSCCWDNYRTSYPFLMLGYPDVMKDIVNIYLARYQRDGYMGGNICLFTGPMEDNSNVRISPILISQAYASGIQADFSKLYGALKDNYSNDKYFSPSLSRLGFDTQPSSGGMACSRTLEYSSSLHSMALLAKASSDPESMQKYYRLSKSYKNVWDSSNQVFRVKNADGTWGPMESKNWTWNPNPQGLFEGTTPDWMFAVPHDPYGLIGLPGQRDFVGRVIRYCLNDTWFNDYQYQYPYLLYYAGAANAAQKIVHDSWVPLFKEAVMYEEVTPKPPHHTWKSHYTSNAGWLLCSMTGLFPMVAPAGQYILTSPSLTKTVMRHGNKDIVVRVHGGTAKNVFIRTIMVDGKVYPCYMIPAGRLVAGAAIDLDMGSDSTEGLGDLYISSTDGYVRSAELISSSHLRCTIDAAVQDATTKVFSRTRPLRVAVNGRVTDAWMYAEGEKTVTIQTTGTAVVEAFTR